MTKSELTELEQKTIQVINESDEAIYQNELHERINCSSGHASKIARKLVDEELINRKKGDNNKYILYSCKKDPEDLDFSLLMAGNMLSPFVGEEEVDIQSERFTKWLMNLVNEEQN